MAKRWTLFLISAGVLLSGCGQSEKTEAGLTENVKNYESMSYGEYKMKTGNEAEFYHAGLFTAEISESSLCAVYLGEYDENMAGAVLSDDDMPIRLQVDLNVLLYGIEKEISLTDFAESLSKGGGKKAVYEILEGGGTAYYVGNKYARVQFDSDKDGKYDRQLSISMSQSESEIITPESAAWLEVMK